MSIRNEWRGFGNLGCDPEIYETGNDTIIVRCSMATTDKCVDMKTGLLYENTEWHKLVAYGKVAENVAKVFRKGHEILVTAALQTYQNRTELRIINFTITKYAKSTNQKPLERPKLEKKLIKNLSENEIVDIDEYYSNKYLTNDQR